MKKSVIIIGGGLAGLASAVFLCGKGFDISVYESSPKLGGRTYSFFDRKKKVYIDNGQHILAGWYENTFDYLKMIGTFGMIDGQGRMRLVFCDRNKKSYVFENGFLPGVFGLVSGVFRFKGFNFKDKTGFLKIRGLLKDKKYSSGYLNNLNVSSLLDELHQTRNLRKYFWNPFILAAFNASPEKVSAELFLKLVKKGTELRKNMSIILSGGTLNELFIDGAVNFLGAKSVILKLNAGVKKINTDGSKVINIETSDGRKLISDYYISAVPDYAFKKLFANEKISWFLNSEENLKSSSIISVHLFFKKPFAIGLKEKMIGLVDSVVQWVFVKSDTHLCLVISAADYLENNLTEKENDDIFILCINDLKSCLEGFDENNILDYKVIKERKATFLPETGSEKFRFKQKSNFDNLFIAGDWTDTGYPSTIEGAVKSAKICSELIINN